MTAKRIKQISPRKLDIDVECNEFTKVLGNMFAELVVKFGRKHMPIAMSDFNIPAPLDNENTQPALASEKILNAVKRRDALEESLALTCSVKLEMERKSKHNKKALVKKSSSKFALTNHPKGAISPSARKFAKFKRDPHSFFADAQNSVLRGAKRFFREKTR